MRAFLLSLLLVPGFAVAHGDVPSFEAEVGPFTIDIGYTDLALGEDVTFDFDLFRTGPPLAYADFARVDVRLTQEGTDVASSSLPNDPDRIPSWTVQFPSSGGYELDVRYIDASETLLAARTFHVEIPTPSGMMLERSGSVLLYLVAAGLLLLSIGIAANALWDRLRTRRAA